MKLVFVYWGYENAGSMLDLRGYARAAQAMGHEVTVYGPPNPVFALDYSQDLAGADAVIFVFEWTTALQFGDRLDWARLLTSVPRQRRVVIDCDGAYNDPIEFDGDYNHRTEESSRYWTDVCDSLSDKIFQPTLAAAAAERAAVPVPHLRPDVGDAAGFRRQRILHDLRRPHQVPVARHVPRAAGDRAGAGAGGTRRAGRRGLGQPAGMDPMAGSHGNDYYVDRDYLKRLEIEAMPPIPYPAGCRDHEQGRCSTRSSTGRCSNAWTWSPAGRSRPPRRGPFRCSFWSRTTFARSMATVRRN